MRSPRRSVRLRLTLLYGSLFLLSGALLLAITYLLVANQAGPQFAAMEWMVMQPATTASPLAALPDQQEAEERSQVQVDQQAENVLHQLLIQSAVALTVMTVVSIGLGWLMAGRVLRPLRTIITAARTVSAHSLHERLALDGPEDEFKELGDTFDTLLARLEASFEAQRQFAANASHELRTPLTRARTLLEVALSNPQPTVADLQKACRRALIAGQQQERVVEALLTLARSERGIDHGEAVDLSVVVREAILGVRPQATVLDLHVSSALSPAVTWGDTRLIERLVANLVDNAVRHNIAGGQVNIATAGRDGLAILSVVNTGPVVPFHEVARLIRPFQRLATDRAANRDGHGLGLAIVQAITTTHGGSLTARPVPEGGLHVEVTFPAHA